MEFIRKHAHGLKLPQCEIEKIVRLKNSIWPYSIESQISWWKKNSNDDDDYFYFYFPGGKIIAFLRISNRNIIVGETNFLANCISEVCVDKSIQKKGIGLDLISYAVSIISNKNKNIIFLLCRTSEEGFYSACGFKKIQGEIKIRNSNIKERGLEPDEVFMCKNYFNVKKNTKIVLIGNLF